MSAASRWTLDRREDGVAVVVEEGGRVLELPAWMVPADARDGDALRVEITQAAGEVRISVVRDAAASGAARVEAAVRLARLRDADDGGKVVL